MTTHTRAWRSFKRTEDCACLFAALIYAGATLHAWRTLPGTSDLKLLVTLAAPSVFLALTVLGAILVPPLRTLLRGYVWASFRAGFGQTAWSILGGLSLLAFAAVLIYLNISGAAHGGRYPAGVFSGYAAGIGILIVQAVLVRSLERDPQVRPVIEQ